MPTKIFHPDHGIVFSGDDREIKALLDKGGKIITKEQENEKTEETTKTEVLDNKPQGLYMPDTGYGDVIVKGDSLENIEVNVSKSQAKRLKHQRYGDK